MQSVKLLPHHLDSVRVSQPRHVVYREFPSETVVLNLETGAYHGLNPVGGRMLVELHGAPSVGAAANRLATEYGTPLDTMEHDVRQFCVDLLDRGLLVMEPA
jgi:hypothetical protein